MTSTMSNIEAVAWSDTLVLTVKPQDMEALLEELGSAVTPDHLVISFAAGIRTPSSSASSPTARRSFA